MARGGCHVDKVIWGSVRSTRLVESDSKSRMTYQANKVIYITTYSRKEMCSGNVNVARTRS